MFCHWWSKKKKKGFYVKSQNHNVNFLVMATLNPFRILYILDRNNFHLYAMLSHHLHTVTLCSRALGSVDQNLSPSVL